MSFDIGASLPPMFWLPRTFDGQHIFVGADDEHRTERFDRGQPTHDGVAPGP